MLQRIIGGLVLMFIGIMLAVNPRGVWAVTEKWKLLGNADASPAFMLVMRVVGAACAVIGLLVTLGVLH